MSTNDNINAILPSFDQYTEIFADLDDKRLNMIVWLAKDDEDYRYVKIEHIDWGGIAKDIFLCEDYDGVTFSVEYEDDQDPGELIKAELDHEQFFECFINKKDIKDILFHYLADRSDIKSILYNLLNKKAA